MSLDPDNIQIGILASLIMVTLLIFTSGAKADDLKCFVNSNDPLVLNDVQIDKPIDTNQTTYAVHVGEKTIYVPTSQCSIMINNS